MNYWLIIRLPILFAIGVSDRVGGLERKLVDLAWNQANDLGKVNSLSLLSICSAGQLSHLHPGHLHCGIQTEG